MILTLGLGGLAPVRVNVRVNGEALGRSEYIYPKEIGDADSA